MGTEDNLWFEEQEAINGIRMSWKTLPSLIGMDPAESIVPMGALYMPLKKNRADCISGDPDLCTNINCGAVFNVHSKISDETTWICNFCSQVNHAPDRRRLRQFRHSTVEYIHSPLSPIHTGHFSV